MTNLVRNLIEQPQEDLAGLLRARHLRKMGLGLSEMVEVSVKREDESRCCADEAVHATRRSHLPAPQARPDIMAGIRIDAGLGDHQQSCCNLIQHTKRLWTGRNAQTCETDLASMLPSFGHGLPTVYLMMGHTTHEGKGYEATEAKPSHQWYSSPCEATL